MKLHLSCGRLIKQINDTMEKDANNALRSHDLTMAQMGALIELGGMPERQASLKELERRLHVAQSTTAGIVARLEQKGMVEGFGNPKDKRIKMVRLTAVGEEYLKTAEGQAARAEEKLLAPLTGAERETFYRLLKKITQTT